MQDRTRLEHARAATSRRSGSVERGRVLHVGRRAATRCWSLDDSTEAQHRRSSSPLRPDASAMDAWKHLDPALGGILSTSTLAEHGIGQSAIRRLLRDGTLVRVRQGWYARPGLADTVVRAARVGGVLTCSTALDSAGIWTIGDRRLHVGVPSTASRLRSADDSSRRLGPRSDVRVHWLARAPEPGALIADPVAALTSLRSCAPTELYLASLDAALHTAPELWHELELAGHPVGRRGIDGTCESGIETLFWLRLSHRLPMRRQVQLPGVGRVDVLIGTALVVELDGRAFHDTASTFEEDRRRDALLSTLGYRVLRFSFRQVMHDWPSVEAAVLAAVARGDDSRVPRR